MTRHAKTRLSKDKRSLEIFVRIESSQCNVKRNVGWQWEGNEIIAGQYSVMGWDVVKSKCQVDFPETMIPKQKSKNEERENPKKSISECLNFLQSITMDGHQMQYQASRSMSTPI